MVTACLIDGYRSCCLSVNGSANFDTLLLANLSLHCLICFHSLNFGSNIANIGPELHSMPINHLSIFLNVSPCKGLGRKPACMSSVGQCSTSNSCFLMMTMTASYPKPRDVLPSPVKSNRLVKLGGELCKAMRTLHSKGCRKLDTMMPYCRDWV